MLRLLLPFLMAVSFAPAAVAEGELPATCPADLAALDATFVETQQRLETAWKSEDDAQKCAAIRHHLEVMQHAASIFDVCTTGHGREENMGQAIGTIADFEDIASELQCP